MSDMVERVAKAISLWDGSDWEGKIGGREVVRERYRLVARAAIEAMHELSAEQIERAAQMLREYEMQYGINPAPWENLNEKIKQHFRGKVRVVVDAVGSEG